MASIRKLAVAAFLPLALLAPSAHAQTDIAVAVGVGIIDPGLPTSGCDFQDHVDFDATLTVNVATDGHTGVYNVGFRGSSSICESLNAGQGSGNLIGDVTGTVNYGRTGPIVTITGQGAINGSPHHIFLGVCVFVPTSINPVVSYALECDVVIDAD